MTGLTTQLESGAYFSQNNVTRNMTQFQLCIIIHRLHFSIHFFEFEHFIFILLFFSNIGQLACLYAKQHSLTRILFGGFFIRGHYLTMEVSIDYC